MRLPGLAGAGPSVIKDVRASVCNHLAITPFVIADLRLNMTVSLERPVETDLSLPSCRDQGCCIESLHGMCTPVLSSERCGSLFHPVSLSPRLRPPGCAFPSHLAGVFLGRINPPLKRLGGCISLVTRIGPQSCLHLTALSLIRYARSSQRTAANLRWPLSTQAD